MKLTARLTSTSSTFERLKNTMKSSSTRNTNASGEIRSGTSVAKQPLLPPLKAIRKPWRISAFSMKPSLCLCGRTTTSGQSGRSLIGLRRMNSEWRVRPTNGSGWMQISSGLGTLRSTNPISCGFRSSRGTGMLWLNSRYAPPSNLVGGYDLNFVFSSTGATSSSPTAVRDCLQFFDAHRFSPELLLPRSDGSGFVAHAGERVVLKED